MKRLEFITLLGGATVLLGSRHLVRDQKQPLCDKVEDESSEEHAKRVLGD